VRPGCCEVLHSLRAAAFSVRRRRDADCVGLLPPLPASACEAEEGLQQPQSCCEVPFQHSQHNGAQRPACFHQVYHWVPSLTGRRALCNGPSSVSHPHRMSLLEDQCVPKPWAHLSIAEPNAEPSVFSFSLRSGRAPSGRQHHLQQHPHSPHHP